MEIWKGIFTHDEADYGVQDDVNFELHVKIINGSFEGIATDPEYSKLSNIPVMVNGYLEGDHINFSKIYPYWYGLDENDVLYIDKTKKNHKVDYDGYYNPDLNKWTGYWEVIVDEAMVNSKTTTPVYLGGTWEMDLPFDMYDAQ